ncbi:short-chain dehydrogenase [Ensifer sp. Root31]|uniref:SDR family oxidoreductase n=1 Tax=Ensifer TaxID=106591 RepID=UPI00070AD933|nr:SDR family oxidoreductase [Ensifer sp. Root31]KQU96041.1 short-chain dehydrogenase [Ensifer sp. Root31]
MLQQRTHHPVVVITGASSGIGQAAAEEFARRGARLVIAARDASALHSVASRCRKLGGEVLVVPTDVTKADEVRQLAQKALSFGEIDVWFSNAGVGAVGKFDETPQEAHEQVIRTNLIGHLNDAYAVVPIFKRQKHGTFINMISLGGFASAPYAAAYSASKFGLKGFTESLRAELAPYRDIHICDVYPTFLDTPGIAHSANYTGHALTAPPPVYDPRKAARSIVRLVDRPRASLTLGSAARLARLGHFLAPNSTARIMAGVLARYLKGAPLTEITHGNLFRSAANPGGVEGGLRVSRPLPTSAILTIVVIGFAAIALARTRR